LANLIYRASVRSVTAILVPIEATHLTVQRQLRKAEARTRVHTYTFHDRSFVKHTADAFPCFGVMMSA
jgi:hypothetical protein